MTEPAVKLVNNAFVCLADDRLVFSDVRQDRYRCLNRRSTQAVLRLFPDLAPVGTLGDADCQDNNEELSGHVLRGLVQAGLLTEDEANGKAVAPPGILPATDSVDMRASSSMPAFRYWVSFARAAIVASASFRVQSLQRILRRVEVRKRRYAGAAANDLLELVAVFHRLRPYYIREYLCRFDSLALIEFLAYHGCYPDWVFGVTAEPFTAHCWVQDGDCVLNDSADFVRRFTPIMAF